MTRLAGAGNSKMPSWWPALIPLLLAALLASVQLDDLAFNRDEPDSLYSAGIYSSGPGTLAEVWSFIEATHPTQTQGWSKLLFVQGRLVGWSEAAVRALPVLVGLLTLARLYRAGRDLLSPGAGLLAALLLGASVFFLSYMTVARGFTLVALFTTLIVWSYGRLTLTPRPAGNGVLALLWLGAAGLLYSHYFASLFLPALGIFHGLFVPKTRRWWRVTLALALALPVALPQAPGLLGGLSTTQANAALRGGALNAAEVSDHLLRFSSNFLVHLPPPLGALLPALLPLALALLAWRRRREGEGPDAVWMLSFVAAAAFLIMLAVNEAAGVITGSRMRYLMLLLPLIMLLAGAALCRGIRAFPRAGLAVLAFWLFLGAALFHGDAAWLIDRHPSTFHHVQRILQQRVGVGDLVVLERSLRGKDVLYLNPAYIPLSDQPWDSVFWAHGKPLDSAAPVHSPYRNLWLVFPADLSDVALTPDNAPGRVACESMDDVAGFTLLRYGRAADGCQPAADLLAFERDIQLTGLTLALRDGLLRLEAGLRSADDYLLSHYSLALHVIQARTGERVAQGDVGVGPGRFVPLRSETDLSALPPGEYELHVALYDWQTGERLNARDLQSGLVGDMHVLHRFRIDGAP